MITSVSPVKQQGFEARIRSVLGQVCQSFTVVSNCIPGSPHTCAASAIRRIRSRARCVPATRCSSVTARVSHGSSSASAFMNASVTRTLLFAFWKKIDA